MKRILTEIMSILPIFAALSVGAADGRELCDAQGRESEVKQQKLKQREET